MYHDQKLAIGAMNKLLKVSKSRICVRNYRLLPKSVIITICRILVDADANYALVDMIFFF